MRDVMVDLETLATSSDALVVSIGAVKFDHTGLGDTFYKLIKLERYNGQIDVDTIAWWINNTDDVRDVFSKKHDRLRVGLEHALRAFTEFTTVDGSLRLWGHGSSFDIPILENSYKICNLEVPRGHRTARDTRTILDLTGLRVHLKPGEKHHALNDAKQQALTVIEAAKVLGFHTLWPETAIKREIGD